MPRPWRARIPYPRPTGPICTARTRWESRSCVTAATAHVAYCNGRRHRARRHTGPLAACPNRCGQRLTTSTCRESACRPTGWSRTCARTAMSRHRPARSVCRWRRRRTETSGIAGRRRGSSRPTAQLSAASSTPSRPQSSRPCRRMNRYLTGPCRRSWRRTYRRSA